MRRLIVASGTDIDAWVQRTRRAAEFVSSLSPKQADVISTQALAIAAEPEDVGTPEQVEAAEMLFSVVEPADRPKRLWQLLLDYRHRHYPDAPDDEAE